MSSQTRLRWVFGTAAVVVLFAVFVSLSGRVRYWLYSGSLRLAHEDHVRWMLPVARAFKARSLDDRAATNAALDDMSQRLGDEWAWLSLLLSSRNQSVLAVELADFYETEETGSYGRINAAYVMALLTGEKEWLNRMIAVAQGSDVRARGLVLLRVWMLIGDSDLDDPSFPQDDGSELEKRWLKWVPEAEATRRLRRKAAAIVKFVDGG